MLITGTESALHFTIPVSAQVYTTRKGESGALFVRHHKDYGPESDHTPNLHWCNTNEFTVVALDLYIGAYEDRAWPKDAPRY